MRILNLLRFTLIAVLTSFRSFINELYRLSEQLYHKYKVGDVRLKQAALSNFFTSESIRNYTYLDGTSGVTDICLLKAIAGSIKYCRYLEIGTFRGESLCNVMDEASFYRAISLEISDDIRAITTDRMIACGKMIKENSYTLGVLSSINKYDLIFIDGSHEYDDIKRDTINAFRLLRPGGVIVWHDYGKSMEKVNYVTLSAIIAGTPTDKIGKVYHVQNTICAVYTERELTPAVNLPLYKVSVSGQ